MIPEFHWGGPKDAAWGLEILVRQTKPQTSTVVCLCCAEVQRWVLLFCVEGLWPVNVSEQLETKMGVQTMPKIFSAQPYEPFALNSAAYTLKASRKPYTK